MLRRLSTLVVLMTIYSFLHAQLEGANWFLREVGVSHVSGQPIPFIPAFGEMATASISSAQGDLLAVSDTGVLFNASGNVMLNGQGLLSNGLWGAPMDDMILPYPGHPGQYWLFKLGQSNSTTPDLRTYANRFDVTAGGGAGEVLDKNLVLWDSTCLFMTAVPDSALDRYWVIQHEPHTNRFLSFELSPQGLSFGPVVSSVGQAPPSFVAPWQLMGRDIVASPNHDQLAWARQYSNSGASTLIELFDFDVQTGMVSGPITIDGPARFQSVSYSHSGERLYVIQYFPSGPIVYRLWEYDVTLPDSASIAGSKGLLFELPASPTFPVLAKMLLAPDGLVYVGQGGTGVDQLGVILPPDSPGSSSTYVHQGVLLPTGTAGVLLPNNMAEYLPVTNTSTTGYRIPAPLGLFPNPASDQLQVSLPMGLAQVSHFVLRDATGRLVRQWTASLGQTSLLLHGTAAGCYLLQAVDQCGRSLAQERVVVQ